MLTWHNIHSRHLLRIVRYDRYDINDICQYGCLKIHWDTHNRDLNPKVPTAFILKWKLEKIIWFVRFFSVNLKIKKWQRKHNQTENILMSLEIEGWFCLPHLRSIYRYVTSSWSSYISDKASYHPDAPSERTRFNAGCRPASVASHYITLICMSTHLYYIVNNYMIGLDKWFTSEYMYNKLGLSCAKLKSSWG